MSGSATLYGLGVGPGDPELMTLKAVRILRQVPVIAYLVPAGGDSLARAIAAAHLPGGQTEIAMVAAMVPDQSPAHATYDRYAGEIAVHLEAKRDVAVLCEGDPFFYGSFMYLFERLAGEHTVRVVPGVSSLGAASAAAGMPLVSRNEILIALPATLAEEELESRLAAADTAAIFKVGRHLDKVRRVLARLGLEAGARYVERATMDGERILALDEIAGKAPYFSLILVRRPRGNSR